MISSSSVFSHTLGFIRKCDDFAKEHAVVANVLKEIAKTAFEWTICLTAALLFPVPYTIVVIGAIYVVCAAWVAWSVVTWLDEQTTQDLLMDSLTQVKDKKWCFHWWNHFMNAEERDRIALEIFWIATKIFAASFPLVSLLEAFGLSSFSLLGMIGPSVDRAGRRGAIDQLNELCMDSQSTNLHTAENVEAFFSFFRTFCHQMGETIVDEIARGTTSYENYCEYDTEYYLNYHFVSSTMIKMFDQDFLFSDPVFSDDLNRLKAEWKQFTTEQKSILRQYFRPRPADQVILFSQESEKKFRNQIQLFSQHTIRQQSGGLTASFEENIRKYVTERSYIAKLDFLPPGLIKMASSLIESAKAFFYLYDPEDS